MCLLRNLLDWLVDMLRDAAKQSQHMVPAYEFFSKARREDHGKSRKDQCPKGADVFTHVAESLSAVLSQFLDMLNRSVFESSCDIHIDITENELKTLQELTKQVCEQFKQECNANRSELAAFANVQYERSRARQKVEPTEEDKQRSEMEIAT